jgi:F0F1-type ATP synthase delta subunit
LQLKEDTYLIGGFTLTVGDMVYDNSLSGRLLELQKIMRGGEYRE